MVIGSNSSVVWWRHSFNKLLDAWERAARPTAAAALDDDANLPNWLAAYGLESIPFPNPSPGIDFLNPGKFGDWGGTDFDNLLLHSRRPSVNRLVQVEMFGYEFKREDAGIENGIYLNNRDCDYYTSHIPHPWLGGNYLALYERLSQGGALPKLVDYLTVFPVTSPSFRQQGTEPNGYWQCQIENSQFKKILPNSSDINLQLIIDDNHTPQYRLEEEIRITDPGFPQEFANILCPGGLDGLNTKPLDGKRQKVIWEQQDWRWELCYFLQTRKPLQDLVSKAEVNQNSLRIEKEDWILHIALAHKEHLPNNGGEHPPEKPHGMVSRWAQNAFGDCHRIFTGFGSEEEE